ncbi:MAG: metallophosphoesterase family protein [Planctomycetes bacterium]|nr:metallophosphoesterase family protein [Planctomycetota bacterium]
MTLAVIGDIHATWDNLGPVLERVRRERVDGILVVGDLGANEFGLLARAAPDTVRNYRESAAEALRRVRSLGVPVLWVPGNHDPRDLAGEGNVDGRVSTVAGLRVAGIGGAGPDRYGFAYEWDEDEILARAVPECDVFLCHAPPRWTPIDMVGRAVHAGSDAIRRCAERHRGVLVCGHIHEAPGFARIGECLCMNVGGLGPPYGRPQVGFVRGMDELGHEDLASGTRQRLLRQG